LEKHFGRSLRKKLAESGLDMAGIHANGSMTLYGSGVDRHQSLDKSLLPKKEIAAFIKKANAPIILETPDSAKWEEEIAWLKKQWR